MILRGERERDAYLEIVPLKIVTKIQENLNANRNTKPLVLLVIDMPIIDLVEAITAIRRLCCICSTQSLYVHVQSQTTILVGLFHFCSLSLFRALFFWQEKKVRSYNVKPRAVKNVFFFFFFFWGLFFTSGSRPSNETSQSFRPRDTRKTKINERELERGKEQRNDWTGPSVLFPSREALLIRSLEFFPTRNII